MTPGVPYPERRLRANRRAGSREARSSTRTESIRALSEREDTVGALADHLVYEELPAKEERPIRAERAVLVSQSPLKDVIAGILELTEYAVTALITLESHM